MNKPSLIVLIHLLLLTGCTTITPKLGIENSQLTPCSTKPNCVNSQIKDDAHYIEPILTKGSQSDVHRQLLEILGELKRAKTVVAEANYIRAEFTSAVFRFVDDVEFYFPDTALEEITIHIRSASRVGHSDFGINRKRIEQIRHQFKS
jgi:uncharacterized protein (DUF1499 family)